MPECHLLLIDYLISHFRQYEIRCFVSIQEIFMIFSEVQVIFECIYSRKWLNWIVSTCPLHVNNIQLFPISWNGGFLKNEMVDTFFIMYLQLHHSLRWPIDFPCSMHLCISLYFNNKILLINFEWHDILYFHLWIVDIGYWFVGSLVFINK